MHVRYVDNSNDMNSLAKVQEIEFPAHGDERGQLKGLAPSQYICIALILGAGVLWYFYKTKIFKKEVEENHEI